MDQLYTFDLPKELIAQEPVSPRDHARLLVFDRKSKTLIDDYFYNLTKYLEKDTLVVANNTKVNHCRYLFDEGKTEIFVVEAVNNKTVRAMVRPGKKFRDGTTIELESGLTAEVTAIDSNGLRTIVFNIPRDNDILVRASHVPLPPYIAQNDTLAEEYQTVYSRTLGSLAAPTAGLHFTPELKSRVENEFGWAEVTLDVGLGTFASLTEENFRSRSLHAEHYSVDEATYSRIKEAKHVTAVGTTSLRTIESLYRDGSELVGNTDIFITPEYEFARVDSLITNFHLPSTSLLLLVEAFLGDRADLERMYTHAIDKKYRFYSFGDGMLIL